MKEIELLSKRKKREKHFLQEDGTIRAEIYDDDIHFLKNGKYEEIDNSLIKANGFYENKNNLYKVKFSESSEKDLMNLQMNKYFINFKLKNNRGVKATKMLDTITNRMLNDKIDYFNIFDGIDLDYKLEPNKIKESFILKNKNQIIEQLEFQLNTNLDLQQFENGSIIASDKNKTIFIIEAPYMEDANGEINNNVSYCLTKNSSKNCYDISLKLDIEWLKNINTKFPVIIDPTITTSGQETNVYDTYIYPNDTNVSRGSQDVLKAGVDENNIVYRTLLKFDLPIIGTGSQVIDAKLNLVGYPLYLWFDNYKQILMSIHQITSDWTEEGATWENMNDKYNDKVEACFYGYRSCLHYDGSIGNAYYVWANITKIVKKWYTDTPNYGVLIKASQEVYQQEFLPAFFSKNHTVSGSNPQPLLQITYRNQNGLESYLDYQEIKLYKGSVLTNTYNGNLISVFELNKTVGSKLPAILKLYYNTNDVILNNDNGFGVGFKLNYQHTIAETTIEEKNYLEYVDEDGTIHYFAERIREEYNPEDNEIHYYNDTPGTFYDEDGLDLKIVKNEEIYKLYNNTNDVMTFEKKGNIWCLVEYCNVSNDKIQIFYNTENLISKIIDSSSKTIDFIYEDNKIIITDSNQSISLNLVSNKLISIITKDGTINLEYNTNNIISKIKDVNNKCFEFDYYSLVPYRIAKITEYGTNNGLGNVLNFDYTFNCTTITDNKGKGNNILYNNLGNAISLTSSTVDEKLHDALSIEKYYGDELYYCNKLLYKHMPIQYVKNYLVNTSFETEQLLFNTTDNIQLELSSEYAVSGNKSLKITSTSNNLTKAYYEVAVPKGENYTFSCYLRGNINVNLSMSYIDKDGNVVENNKCTIYLDSDFHRYDITVNYPLDAISNLIINIELINEGIIYIDDIQLEEGEAVNYYNYIENSDFSNGMNGWTYNGDSPYEIVEIGDTQALKIKMTPETASGIMKHFEINGKGNEQYTLAFWYKNEGLSDTARNEVMFNFGYLEMPEYGSCVLQIPLESSNDKWRYFSFDFITDSDYSGATLYLDQESNANDLYITNFSLFKNEKYKEMDYDDNGNLISFNDLNDSISKFNYNINNELTSISNSKGIINSYEYDNIITNRVLRGFSNDGMCSQMIYDEFGNIKANKTFTPNINIEIISAEYVIRKKGTNKYVSVKNGNILLSERFSSRYIFKLEKINDNYTIKSNFYNKYLCNNNGVLTLDSFVADSDAFLFSLSKNNDNSYTIKSLVNDKYLKCTNFNIELSDFEEKNVDYLFYFETFSSKYFIENSSQYNETGTFINKMIDSNMNETSFVIDETTGLNTSTLYPNKKRVNYIYDEKNRIKELVSDNKKIELEYNTYNLLSQIRYNDINYKLNYDEFLNTSEFYVNDILLFKNNYDDENGNLNSIIYGNNDVIKYEYDNFDRISKLIKMDKTYRNVYDKSGMLSKIISNNLQVKAIYDSGKRIKQYSYNEFNIFNNYDEDNNIIESKFLLEDINNTINNEFNNNNLITKCVFDSNILDYIYDDLGRLKSKKFNSAFNEQINYINNGYRTTLLVKSIENNNGKYSYKYDNMNNITHIYYNGNITNRYFYDNNSQLIKEFDYVRNLIIIYEYDNYNNLLSETKYDLTNYQNLDKTKYEYNYNQWKNQVSKINDEEISYNSIGNITQIGNNISLSWINGNELKTYKDIEKNINISYEYNYDGTRATKVVNNVKTEFFLSGKKIIYQKTGEDILYFLRDGMGELFGFKYNNQTYFYQKNLQDDIIAILNINFEKIVEYQYDSWGNIISMIDNSNCNLGNINPFRYRSYYFDEETQLYYLNARYYSPALKKFISPDTILKINGKMIECNLYSYAGNNPINYIDVDGTFRINIGKKIKQKFNSLKKKASKKIKEIKKAFTFEIGVGLGLSEGLKIGNTGLKAGLYKDYNWGYENGETYESTSESIGINYEGMGKNFGIDYSGEHRIHHDLQDPVLHYNPFAFSFFMPDCPETDSGFTIVNEKYNIKGEKGLGEDETFFGLDLEAHVVFGGHIKIGFNIDVSN